MLTSNAILISPYKSCITSKIKSLQQDYDLTNKGELKDFLGTRFVKNNDGSIAPLPLNHPWMVDQVLCIMVGLDPIDTRTKMHDTPAAKQLQIIKQRAQQ